MAGALGIRRDEGQRLSSLHTGLGVGVLVKHDGSLLQDYHTAQAPHAKYAGKWTTRRQALEMRDLSTVLSWRSYRCDALYRVALWQREDAPVTLGGIRDALRRPVFVPSLGRRSCVVALPMTPRLENAAMIEGALADYERRDEVIAMGVRLSRLAIRREKDQLLAADEDVVFAEGVRTRTITRRDAMESYRASRWHYLDRKEVQRQLPRGS